MNNPDQDTVLRAINDVQLILAEYMSPGPHDATRTVERVLAILDNDNMAHALSRLKRRSVLRVVE